MSQRKSLRERIGEFVAGPTFEKMRQDFKEELKMAEVNGVALGKQLAMEAMGPDTGITSIGYFADKFTESGKDLELSEHKEMIKRANVFYYTHGLAKRSLDIVLDYAMGSDGFSYEVMKAQTKNAAVANVLNELWEGALNSFATRQHDDARDFLLAGDICYPLWMRPNGTYEYGYFDSYFIQYVIPDPENYRRLKWVAIDAGAGEYIAMRIVRQFELREYRDPHIKVADEVRRKAIVEGSKWEGLLAGAVDIEMERAILNHDLDRWNHLGNRKYTIRPKLDPRGTGQSSCIYQSINRSPGATRGKSILLHGMDNIQLHQRTLLNVVNRAAIHNAFCWHAIFTGENDEEKIEEKANKLGLNVITPNKVFKTNEKIEIKALSPDLAGSDNAAIEKMIRETTLGDYGLPAHFYGSGSSTNLATAKAQEDPVLRTMEAMQTKLVNLFKTVCQVQLDAKIAFGLLERNEKNYRDAYEVKTRSVRSKDDVDTANVLATTSTALALAEDRQWNTREEVQKIWNDVLVESGYTVPDDLTSDEIINPKPEGVAPSPLMNTGYEEYITGEARDTETVTAIFSKDDFDLGAAKAWLKRNNLQYGKVDETDESYRFQQEEDGGKYKRMRTIKADKGVSLVVGWLK